MIGTLALSFLMIQDPGTSSGPVARETVYARIGKARQMAADSILMAALKVKNQSGENPDEIKRKDEQWVASRSHPLRRELTTGGCADRLRTLVQGDAFLVGAAVVDHHGALVCASAEPPTYSRAATSGWQKTLVEGAPLFAGPSEAEPAGQASSVELSVPMIADDKRAGVLTLWIRPPLARASAEGDRPAIVNLLKRYETALVTRDLPSLRALWPTMDKAQEKRILPTFAYLRRVSVNLQVLELTITGETASVTCLRRDEVTTVEGRNLVNTAKTEIGVRHSGQGWVIDSIR